MTKKKKPKIAIVLDGKDICRIIPFNSDMGKYELKIDFLENDFDITLYKLFCVEPIKLELIDSSEREVTYHRGANDKPLRIHLKHKENHTYETLPLDKIKPPDVNSMFPIPILKIEVPTKSSEIKYIPKDYHRVIDPEDCNVLEIYLAHSNYDLENVEKKLPGVFIAFLTLSFEIYATNTVTTGKQKYANFLPRREPKTVLSPIKVLGDMQIIPIFYKDLLLDEKLTKINVTFIENELSEAILGMMQIRYPPNSRDGVFDGIYLGGATLRDVNQPIKPIARPSIGENNLLSDSLKRNLLTDEEKNKIYWQALKLRIQLRDALIEKQNRENLTALK